MRGRPVAFFGFVTLAVLLAACSEVNEPAQPSVPAVVEEPSVPAVPEAVNGAVLASEPIYDWLR